MIAMRRILSWSKRRWRARGFGIHSPFAYKFVTGVLAIRLSEDNKTKLRELVGRSYRRYALLYRCIQHFKPQTVALAPINNELARIVKLANPTSKIIENNATTIPDMTIITSGTEEMPDNGSEIYYVCGINKEPGRSVWKKLKESSEYGMDFSDYRTGIMCRFKHLPRQSFKIAFK